MNTDIASVHHLEQALGKLLHYGTMLASAVIAVGLTLSHWFVAGGMRVATAGIVLFILLPVARVGAMLIFFLRTGDHRFGAIGTLVLAMMLLSFFLGAN